MNWVVFLGTVISRGSIENRAAQREFAPWMGSFDGSVWRVLLSVWICSWGEALQYLQRENGTSSSGRGAEVKVHLEMLEEWGCPGSKDSRRHGSGARCSLLPDACLSTRMSVYLGMVVFRVLGYSEYQHVATTRPWSRVNIISESLLWMSAHRLV